MPAVRVLEKVSTQPCNKGSGICTEPCDNNNFSSDYDDTFKYHIGEIARPTQPFCEYSTQQCASGIHVFLTQKEAENYGKVTLLLQ